MKKTTAAQQRALDRAAHNCCVVCNTETRGLRRGLCITDYSRYRAAYRQVSRDKRLAFDERLIAEGQLLPSRQGKRQADDINVFEQVLAEFLRDTE